MAKKLTIPFDSALIDSLRAEFDLRDPNVEALRKLIFTLNGDYNPAVMQIINLATGVGKTYLMAALIEYLRRQGIGNVVIVTPGRVVQSKTVGNFSPGNPRYISGAEIPPDIVTPQDYSAWTTRINSTPSLSFGSGLPSLVFIFNIQQLIAPKNVDGDTHGSTQDAERRKPRRFDENAGVLFDYLKKLDDLVIIADESHLYSSSAVAFHAAIEELDPAAAVGLTASVLPGDHVIYEYPLYRAIQDKYVKAPVLAFRKGGYSSDQASEEQQLRDALQLRKIKQAYYDAYADQNGKSRINAVVFVVCADVDHATQVTDLLRSPEYFGRDIAVLQVDSKHEDDTTERLLENIDQPGSPVLAVVSVNKLKEGWDVKNIAVVVTLRAMASEVLTQQTMGRGLRLPFGKHTGVWQIDQLDIIAHQSFQELLTAENVLAQFGLEDAVSQENAGGVTEAITKAAEADNRAVFTAESSQVNDINIGGINAPSPASSFDTFGANIQNGNISTGNINGMPNDENQMPAFSARMIADIHDAEGYMENTDDGDIRPIIIERNPRFSSVSYKFPVTTVNLVQPPIELSEISVETIEKAAKRVTSTGETLYRKEIIAALGKKLRAVDTESAEVDSAPVNDADAKEALEKVILNMQLVPSTETAARYIESFLVPKFMGSVSFKGWTVKSLGSAEAELQAIIRDYIAEVRRATKEVPTIHPCEVNLTGYTLQFGERVYDPIDSADHFQKNRVYSGWFKSLYECEFFDSYSGEYELARLLNTSPHIEWWHRLHPQYGAYIYYNAKDRYFPDFVAMDEVGVHWIIEGKDKRGRDDDKVQAKRKAAEALVQRLAAEEAYAGQLWGYLIAYEDDIAKADSWDDLKTLAQPISNRV